MPYYYIMLCSYIFIYVETDILSCQEFCLILLNFYILGTVQLSSSTIFSRRYTTFYDSHIYKGDKACATDQISRKHRTYLESYITVDFCPCISISDLLKVFIYCSLKKNKIKKSVQLTLSVSDIFQICQMCNLQSTLYFLNKLASKSEKEQFNNSSMI